MSLQTDIHSTLSAVAGGRAYPQIAPQEADLPFVVWRILNKTPLETLGGHAGLTQYSLVFEAWAETYESALSIAGDVQAAIEASALTHYRESAPGEDFEPALDAFMEPVYYGFWHTT